MKVILFEDGARGMNFFDLISGVFEGVVILCSWMKIIDWMSGVVVGMIEVVDFGFFEEVDGLLLKFFSVVGDVFPELDLEGVEDVLVAIDLVEGFVEFDEDGEEEV
jgi:hypothetical protein